MNSMPKSEHTDPRDVAVAALKQAFRETARADQQLPRASDHVSKLEPDAARQPSDQQKWLAVARRMSSRGRLVACGLIALLAACVGTAAVALWSHDDLAKQMMARRLQQLHLISSPAPESPVPAQPSPSAVQASAAKAAPQQPALPAPPAQTALAGAAPTAAAPSPGQAQLLQSMARELAAVEQEIEQLKSSQKQMVRDNAELAEQLKASQEQMARDNAAVAEQLKASQEQMARLIAKAWQEQMVRDNAAVAEQLKASQEQMARLIAKASEQNLRPKTSAPPPRPIATPTRKPVPKLSSPQARAQPQAPMQGRPEQQ
jgi:hypothetical protein